VKEMRTEAMFFVNDELKDVVFSELEEYHKGRQGGIIPAIVQLANVAGLPGIVGLSLGMPDIHCGYGFAIGNIAAMDMNNPDAVVSPGGVGFDINCGVRLIRTNLMESDIGNRRQQLANALFDKIPVGVGSEGDLTCAINQLNEVLSLGIDWSIREGFGWPEDKLHCEEQGRMMNADPNCVSARAKKRGLSQLGTLGAGNHYCEVQVVDEIYDQEAADIMGIGKVGQVVVFLHTGSRGLGHQVCSDSLRDMEKVMKRDKIVVNDRQLACARISSEEGQNYIKAMGAAANFAWVNRQYMTHLIRETFAQFFKTTARDLDMHLVYDVCHNIAKIEDHILNGEKKTLLVHRKGATRAFAPHHPMVPQAYQTCGQPVLIGGSMGTCSYVLTGTREGMELTFGSTCHGAGRNMSRHKSKSNLSDRDVLNNLKNQGIAYKIASPNLVMEEAPESYKDVTAVVDTCHAVGISKKTVKLRPICVIKG